MKYLIKDFGRPEYLDGAMMRYVVEKQKQRGESETVAYVKTLPYAKLIAKALNSKEG